MILLSILKQISKKSLAIILFLTFNFMTFEKYLIRIRSINEKCCHLKQSTTRKTHYYYCTLVKVSKSIFILIVSLKSKITSIVFVVSIWIWLTNPIAANSMGLSPQISNKAEITSLKREPQTRFLGPSTVEISTIPKPKIELVNISNFKLPIGIYLMDEKFLRLPKINEMVVTLRGGENYWRDVILKNLTFVFIVYASLQTVNMCEGFLTEPPPRFEQFAKTINIVVNNIVDPHDKLSTRGSSTVLNAHEPMKTQEDREKLHEYDFSYPANEEHPELRLPFLQVKHKLVSHGAIWGVTFKVKTDKNNNLSTTSPNKEQNALIKRNGIDSIIRSVGTDWFLNGDYQTVNSERSFKTHIAYSSETNRVIIFRASNGCYVSSFEPTLREVEDLMKTGNFKTEHANVSGPKNRPPVVSFNPLDNPLNENSETVIQSKRLLEDTQIINKGTTELRNFDNDIKLICPAQDEVSPSDSSN